MPEDHYLQLLEALRTRAQEQEVQQAAQRQVAERPEQEQLLGISGTGRRLYGRVETSGPRTELTNPTGLPARSTRLRASAAHASPNWRSVLRFHASTRWTSRPRGATSISSPSTSSPSSSTSHSSGRSQYGSWAIRQACTRARHGLTVSTSSHSPGSGHVSPLKGATLPSPRNLYAIIPTSSHGRLRSERPGAPGRCPSLATARWSRSSAASAR